VITLTVAVIVDTIEALVLVGRRGDTVRDNADVIPCVGVDERAREGVQGVEALANVVGLQYERRRCHYVPVHPSLEQKGKPVMIYT